MTSIQTGREQDGWTKVKGGKSYSWPNFKWYQFIQKRRFAKGNSRITPGKRIRLARGQQIKFSDDFTIELWVPPHDKVKALHISFNADEKKWVVYDDGTIILEAKT